MTGTEDEEGQELRLRLQKVVQDILNPQLKRAERAYNQALTSLWVANGAAALATLNFVAGTWHSGSSIRGLLWPLGLFMAGLVCMGIGSTAALICESGSIIRTQYAESVLDMRVGDIKSPAEIAGLTLQNPRTVAGIVSGALFVLGCLVGFVELCLGAS